MGVSCFSVVVPVPVPVPGWVPPVVGAWDGRRREGRGCKGDERIESSGCRAGGILGIVAVGLEGGGPEGSSAVGVEEGEG